MKMYVTQLTGLLQRAIAKNEFAIEDTARLLAQATVGEGHVYFACFDELEALFIQATKGVEPFQNAFKFSETVSLTPADRVIIFARTADDPRVQQVIESLEGRIPFALVSGDKEEATFVEEATTFVTTTVQRGLLPNENGERVIFAHNWVALALFEAIHLAYKELLENE